MTFIQHIDCGSCFAKLDPAGRDSTTQQCFSVRYDITTVGISPSPVAGIQVHTAQSIRSTSCFTALSERSARAAVRRQEMGVSTTTPHNATRSYCIQVRLGVFVHVIAWSPCSSLAPAIERACLEEIQHLPMSPPLRPATSSPSHRLDTRRSRRGNGDQHIHS